MAKARVTLANGTRVEIEGTPEEVKHVLDFYGEGGGSPKPKRIKRQSSSTKSKKTRIGATDEKVDLACIGSAEVGHGWAFC